MNKYGSRKFLFAVGTVAAVSWLVWNKSISDAAYSSIVTWVVGCYLTANSAAGVLSSAASLIQNKAASLSLPTK